jgi:hypothetical protein
MTWEGTNMSPRIVWIAGLLALLGWTVAASAEVVMHSGTVASFDAAAGTLVLDEVGPWQVTDGRTVITKRRIAVAPATEMVMVRRDATASFPGAFVTRPLSRSVAVGDFVSVECTHEGEKMLALRITVIDPQPQ